MSRRIIGAIREESSWAISPLHIWATWGLLLVLIRILMILIIQVRVELMMTKKIVVALLNEMFFFFMKTYNQSICDLAPNDAKEKAEE